MDPRILRRCRLRLVIATRFAINVEEKASIRTTGKEHFVGWRDGAVTVRLTIYATESAIL